MTNHWIDMLNADVVLIMGGNPAEDHPIAMNWLARAKEHGTYILHVDPRFNRTSSIADVFAKLRSGTDIAFVGGMINYAIEHNRIQRGVRARVHQRLLDRRRRLRLRRRSFRRLRSAKAAATINRAGPMRWTGRDGRGATPRSNIPVVCFNY